MSDELDDELSDLPGYIDDEQGLDAPTSDPVFNPGDPLIEEPGTPTFETETPGFDTETPGDDSGCDPCLPPVVWTEDEPSQSPEQSPLQVPTDLVPPGPGESSSDELPVPPGKVELPDEPQDVIPSGQPPSATPADAGPGSDSDPETESEPGETDTEVPVVDPVVPETDVAPSTDDTAIPEDRPAERTDAEISEDAGHWFKQGTGYTCAPSAITSIIADFTDVDMPNEQYVMEKATEYQVLTENGMAPMDVPGLLTELGIPSSLGVVEAPFPDNWQAVDDMLNNGIGIILPVDASQYWEGYENEPPAGHAVRVIDVDVDRGVVVLSDSGTDDGKGLEVPIDLMEDAWQHYEHALIYTQIAESDAEGITPVDPSAVPATVHPDIPDSVTEIPVDAPVQPAAEIPEAIQIDPDELPVVDVDGPTFERGKGVAILSLPIAPLAALYIARRLAEARSKKS